MKRLRPTLGPYNIYELYTTKLFEYEFYPVMNFDIKMYFNISSIYRVSQYIYIKNFF